MLLVYGYLLIVVYGTQTIGDYGKLKKHLAGKCQEGLKMYPVWWIIAMRIILFKLDPKEKCVFLIAAL